jgi:hypothetical protein
MFLYYEENITLLKVSVELDDLYMHLSLLLLSKEHSGVLS